MEIVSFLLYSAFCFWVIFRDGAEVLAEWKESAWFDWFASTLTAQELRFYVGISWLASLAILLFHKLGGT